MQADPTKCMTEAEELKAQIMKECECKEKANREYEANVNGQCSGMTGADYDQCKSALFEVLQEALARCTPTPPSRCEIEADAVYEKKK
jgi:hypothetical protein